MGCCDGARKYCTVPPQLEARQALGHLLYSLVSAIRGERRPVQSVIDISEVVSLVYVQVQIHAV